ncbi:MAG: FkbM family methyltransferase [Actinomycetia bacterium]|nr:FkbM family methyltransferase [Actinomycetes bacterium]
MSRTEEAQQLAGQLAQRLPESVRSRIRGLVRGAPSRAEQVAVEAPTSSSPSDDLMTLDDVYSAYRLFHGRPPDPAGLEFFSSHVGEWSVRQMLPYFAHSDEFRNSDTYRVLVGGVHGDELIEVDRGDYRLLVPTGDGAIGEVLIRTGTYEPHVLNALDSALARGDTFVDCGANIGIITMAAASAVGPTGRVIAFEALLTNANLVRLSAAINQFDHVTVHHAAVADTEDLLVIDTAAGSNGIVNGPLARALEQSRPEVLSQRNLVGSVTLDRALADIDRIDVLKLDIEGAEGLAVRGANAVIAKHRPTILLEYSPDLVERVSGCSGLSVLNDLTELGYTIELLDGPDGRSSAMADELDDLLKSAGRDHFDLVLTPGSAS